jgi:hypothetical protein
MLSRVGGGCAIDVDVDVTPAGQPLGERRAHAYYAGAPHQGSDSMRSELRLFGLKPHRLNGGNTAIQLYQ